MEIEALFTLYCTLMHVMLQQIGMYVLVIFYGYVYVICRNLCLIVAVVFTGGML